jgi:branched-subunit amino acid transport protein
MKSYLVVAAAGVASYVLRLSMIVWIDRIRLPARLDDSAALIAPAAFTALAVTGLAGSVMGGGASHAIAPLAAAIVGALAAARTRRADAALLAGMPTLWILTALIPA